MIKRFKIGDIITWRSILTNESSWHNGLFWKQEGEHYSGIITVYYPSSEPLISKRIKMSEVEVYPELNIEKINSYVIGLISDEKISYPFKDIQKRISDETGEEVYTIDQFILTKLERSDNIEWLEDLIWCPSQLYCRFIDNLTQRIYCIYLRWRHRDPWTAELIPCLPDGKLNYSERWEIIKTKKEYTQNDYEELKKETIDIVKGRFREITWISSNNDIDD